MKISVNVDDHRKVAVQSIEGGSVCGLNVDTIEYELTEEFDLEYKYAFLAIGENVQPVELDALRGSFTMPPMSAGTMRIAFRAFDLEDGQKAHEVITERMARGIRIERHGKHSFGSMEPEANDVLAKMVQAAIDAKAAQVAAEAATTASIEQTSAAKVAEEQRETAFSAKMGEWNREIVGAISDANKAKDAADLAAKNANDAATAAALAEVAASNAAVLADTKAAAAQNAANAANASKASADTAAANANAKATLAGQSAAKADQAAQGANASKASAEQATKAANDAAGAANKAAQDAESDMDAIKEDFSNSKQAWQEEVDALATMFYIDENGYICQKED